MLGTANLGVIASARGIYSSSTTTTSTSSTSTSSTTTTSSSTTTTTSSSTTTSTSTTTLAGSPYITFTNPSYTHKIWRSGVERTGTITTPNGYSTSWFILNHKTRAVVASGNTNTVTHTFTFVSLANCNTYDLLVNISNGIRSYQRVFPGEFTCLPQKPVSYNETWSTSGQHDMGWVNRPGYKIRITGSFTGFINTWWLRSDDPTQPIHIVLDNITVNSGNVQNFRCTAFKNVIIDGCTDEDIPYGMILNKTGTAAQQLFVLEAAEANDAAKRSSNLIICGIEANGANINGAGITAFRFINGRDATNNENTYQIDNITQFNCYGHNTWEEAYYYGQSNDALSGGLGYPYFTNCLYYRLRGENAGNEVFQFGINRNANIFCCTFKNGGTRDQNFHENLVQWSNGNRNTAFFMNYLEQGTHNLIGGSQGRSGQDSEFFANVMFSLGKDADGAGNLWFQCDLSDFFSTISWKFYNNTIQYAVGTAFTLYEAYATKWGNFESVNNLIIGQNTDDYINASGVNPAHVTFSNAKYLTANIGTIGFVDAPNKNYHLTSLSSPAFGTSTSITKTSVFQNYDYEGYRYQTGFPIRGAFSGEELHVFQPFTSIGGTSQVVNGLTYNVDSAELPYSIQKIGNNLFRFEVREGEGRPIVDAGSERSELSGSANTINYGTDVWTAYSFMVDSTSAWTGLAANVVGQFHAGVGSPNLSFRMENFNTFKVIRRVGISSSFTSFTDYTDNAFVPGQWYNIVIQSRFSPGTATGLLNVWINGVQVVNLSGVVTGYSDATDTYFKFGIYRSTSEPDTEIVYFANVETGTTDLSSRILNPLTI